MAVPCGRKAMARWRVQEGGNGQLKGAGGGQWPVEGCRRGAMARWRVQEGGNGRLEGAGGGQWPVGGCRRGMCPSHALHERQTWCDFS